MLTAVIIKVVTMAEKKSHHLQSREEDGLEGWIKLSQDFHPGDRCSCPV